MSWLWKRKEYSQSQPYLIFIKPSKRYITIHQGNVLYVLTPNLICVFLLTTLIEWRLGDIATRDSEKIRYQNPGRQHT